MRLWLCFLANLNNPIQNNKTAVFGYGPFQRHTEVVTAFLKKKEEAQFHFCLHFLVCIGSSDGWSSCSCPRKFTTAGKILSSHHGVIPASCAGASEGGIRILLYKKVMILKLYFNREICGRFSLILKE